MADANSADISSDDGRKITAEALSWKGTAYALVGELSSKQVKGDCSGTTNKIYTAAGFPYEFRSAGTFEAYVENTKKFRKLGADEKRQDGDILLWDAHMAIYSTFQTQSEIAFVTTPRTNKKGQPWTQINDMWTASHTGGPAYGPGAIKWWSSDVPDTYRCLKATTS